ncbi:unnamed protein product, partial [Rotaria magnacalcarata]
AQLLGAQLSGAQLSGLNCRGSTVGGSTVGSPRPLNEQQSEDKHDSTEAIFD